MAAIILLFILSIFSLAIGLHLFKGLGKFWIFIIFTLIYFSILKYGIKNDEIFFDKFTDSSNL